MGLLKRFGRLKRPLNSLQKLLTVVIFVWGFHVTIMKSNHFLSSQENSIESSQMLSQQQHRHISSINQSIDLAEAIEAQTVRHKVLQRFCKMSNVDRNKASTKHNDHKITLISDSENRLGYCHVPKVASSAWYNKAVDKIATSFVCCH